MSKDYISVRRLRRFMADIVEAPVVSRDAVDYLLAVKDGRLYRVSDASAPYLLVTPAEEQWIASGAAVEYAVASNTSWAVV